MSNSKPTQDTLTAIKLAAIAYDDPGSVPCAVKTQTEDAYQVVWGPAQLTDSWTGEAYSSMFIAKDATTGDYMVVIRGTNFESLSSWLGEDFAVKHVCAFGDLPGLESSGIDPSVRISKGSFRGTNDLASLRDPETQKSAVEFLEAETITSLCITGHSLGGTLTPCWFAYLNELLFQGQATSAMRMWSFAGLTPGGDDFNSYLAGLMGPAAQQPWRVQNSLDIAPWFWTSYESVRDIYKANSVDWSLATEVLVHHLFHEADKAPITYAHAPGSGMQVEGEFVQEDWIDEWVSEAFHQHHSATYISRVKKAMQAAPQVQQQ